jgi:polysaccharide chain length determinant protein (PEP-CTERM system associated)
VTTTHDEPVFDPLAVARRRVWSLLVPVAGGIVVGLLLVLWLPREYVASATLAVTTPSVSGDLAKAALQEPADRTRAISQELLSLPVIEQVAREEGLVTGPDTDEVVAGIRARTSVSLPVKPIVAGRGDPDTFIVSYTGATAEEAQRVTNRLLRVFIDSDSTRRQTRAKETAAFLGEQLRESQRRMDEIEGRLRKLKEMNTGLLPEQALANLQAMSDLRSRVDNNAEAIREERDRLAGLEQQVEAARKEASFETRTEDEIRIGERIATLEAELATARRLYTPRHPEVQRLEAAVATARIEQSEVRARAAPLERPPQKAEQTLAQLVAERDRSRIRLRDLQLVENRLPREMAIYEARVNQAPIVEQQLAPLEQAYELEKSQHQKLSERYQAALLSESLETRQAGGRFAVLYPAGLPDKPARPNVPRVFAFSVFAGALVGGVPAFTREYLDKTVHDARTLQHEFDQPVLAEIPHLRSKRA